MFNKSFVGRTSDRIGANKFLTQMNNNSATISQSIDIRISIMSVFLFLHGKHFLVNNEIKNVYVLEILFLFYITASASCFIQKFNYRLLISCHRISIYSIDCTNPHFNNSISVCRKLNTNILMITTVFISLRFLVIIKSNFLKKIN